VSEKIRTGLKLTREQRMRAIELERVVADDEIATAAEIIFLRDDVHHLRNELTKVTLERDALKKGI
jgi:hypothetical protein